MGLLNLFNHLNNNLFASVMYERNLADDVSDFSVRTVIGGIIVLLVIATLALVLLNKFRKLKLPLFILIIVVAGATTLSLIGATLYLNVNSDSGSPVRWQADFEIWACGNELELRNPNQILFSRIGSSRMYERDDRTIHVDGAVVDRNVDSSLGKFFNLVGGEITAGNLRVPLNPEGQNLFEDSTDGDGPSDSYATLIEPFLQPDQDGIRSASFINGQKCGNQESFLQLFVYHYRDDSNTYVQEKIVDPASYYLSGANQVSPGDCLIIEFGPVKGQTDKLCSSYGVRDSNRCEQFGIEPQDSDFCTLKQVEYPLVDPNQNKTAPESGEQDIQPVSQLEGISP